MGIEKKSASLVTDWHFNIRIECLIWQEQQQGLVSLQELVHWPVLVQMALLIQLSLALPTVVFWSLRGGS
jgi:hypothetical protein